MADDTDSMTAGPAIDLIHEKSKEIIMAQLSGFKPSRSEGPLGFEELRKIDAY
jgi:hypothetical protein